MPRAKDPLYVFLLFIASGIHYVFQARGAFMGAITSSDTMFTLPLELRDTLKLDYDHPMGPYDKRSPVLLDYAQGLKALPVPEKLTLEEATSLMSIWKSENVLVGGEFFMFFYSSLL